MLNTGKGTMGQCMEMFLYHKVQENTLGKLSAAEKKEKHRQAVLASNACGDQMFADIMVITDIYAIGLECLAWEHPTWL
jgi:hypothetical protein